MPPDSRFPGPPWEGGRGARQNWSDADRADYATPPTAKQARQVGHLWIEANGEISITPTIHCSSADERRLRAVSVGFARWRSINQRLWAAVTRRGGR
jgi:hypothetical protein